MDDLACWHTLNCSSTDTVKCDERMGKQSPRAWIKQHPSLREECLTLEIILLLSLLPWLLHLCAGYMQSHV
jgi:hypothetical protein